MNYIYSLTAATKLVAASILLLSSVLSTSVSAAQQEHAELIKRFEQKLNFKIISVADANVPGLLQLNKGKVCVKRIYRRDVWLLSEIAQ